MDFVIRKVNGTDLSNATHEETIKAFQLAEEPIIVEVSRRSDDTTSTSTKPTGKSDGVTTTSSTVSTQTDSVIGCYCHHAFTLPSPPPLSGAEEICGEDTDSCTDCNEDYLYEEISLHRGSCCDRIGLTLCYGDEDEDGFTDVYIGEVEDDSLAGRDGRIREGDQILQINNKEVRSRQQAIEQFSESRSDIRLLICRPINSCSQTSEGFLDEELADIFSRPLMPLIKEELSEFEDDSTIADTATLPSRKEKEAKDSGVGHDSAQSSEQECEYSSHYETICKQTEEPNPPEHIANGSSEFRQQLEARCRTLPDDLVEQLCDGLNDLQQQIQQRAVPRMGTRVKLHNEDSLPRSESQDTAYQTDSCQSTPTTLELTKGLSGSALSLSDGKRHPFKSDNSRERKRHRRSAKLPVTTSPSSASPTDIVYTTEDKLAETMAAQQKVLLEQSRPSTAISTNNNNNTINRDDMTNSSNMEWVVKKRVDGTRYVTRRPIKTKILSERKKRLEDERCGLTTDDDAMSELKMGKKWSREDRRRHIQKAREYHQRKALMQEKIELMNRSAQQGHTNFLELSQKKLQKHTMKDLDFITVQELLAHRGKIPLASCNNVLSVTTV